MLNTMVFVALAGPPFVMTSAWPNTCNELMMPITSTKQVDDDSSGSVMNRQRANGPAPSIVAASYSVFGMPCRPARNRTIEKPICCQTLIMIIAGSAQVVLDSQEGGSVTPMAYRKLLSSPKSAW